MSAPLDFAGLLETAMRLARTDAASFSRRALKNSLRRACAALAAAAFGLAALGCALAGLWIALPPYVGAAGAPLVVAAALSALCLVALALARDRRKSAPPPPAMPSELLASSLETFKSNKGAGLLAALLAGLVAGGRDP